jgi:hypothetical protein
VDYHLYSSVLVIMKYYGTRSPTCKSKVSPSTWYGKLICRAHKAADPGSYPIRDEVRQQLPSLVGIEEKYGPTNVHFQIYDGTCHDLPLFSMTTPARGLFRAIASFARFCTPQAPGSLHINTPSNSKLSRPSSKVYTEPLSMTMTSLDIAASPRALSPVGGARTLSIPPSDRRESQISEATTSRSQSVRMDVSGPPTDSEPEIEEDGVRALPKERARTGPVEDEAGPRFGVEDASKDSRAKPGEAGHSGIYNGDNVRLSLSPFPSNSPP